MEDNSVLVRDRVKYAFGWVPVSPNISGEKSTEEEFSLTEEERRLLNELDSEARDVITREPSSNRSRESPGYELQFFSPSYAEQESQEVIALLKSIVESQSIEQNTNEYYKSVVKEIVEKSGVAEPTVKKVLYGFVKWRLRLSADDPNLSSIEEVRLDALSTLIVRNIVRADSETQNDDNYTNQGKNEGDSIKDQNKNKNRKIPMQFKQWGKWLKNIVFVLVCLAAIILAFFNQLELTSGLVLIITMLGLSLGIDLGKAEKVLQEYKKSVS